jgi:hypothetical protein
MSLFFGFNLCFLSSSIWQITPFYPHLCNQLYASFLKTASLFIISILSGQLLGSILCFWLFRSNIFLMGQNVNNRQNANSIKNRDADKPGKMVVPRRLPESNKFPYQIPDAKNYQDQDQ